MMMMHLKCQFNPKGTQGRCGAFDFLQDFFKIKIPSIGPKSVKCPLTWVA